MSYYSSALSTLQNIIKAIPQNIVPIAKNTANYIFNVKYKNPRVVSN